MREEGMGLVIDSWGGITDSDIRDFGDPRDTEGD